MASVFDQVTSIGFVDLGCSGKLDKKWRPLTGLLEYVGFDPNAAECERLASEPHPFRSRRYIPFAVAGEPGSQPLYKTESIYCYSLLKPNHPWLQRFTFANLFRETGSETVPCTTLDELVEREGLRTDILKLDTQGLELPILRAGTRLTENAFCIETETGFVQNYIGETTYADVDTYLRSVGYLMFDMNMEHRISRQNPLADAGQHQPLWCEAVWLFDYIGRQKVPTREIAMRSLLICKALQYFDYGVELARYYRTLDLLDGDAAAELESPAAWTS